MFRQVAFSTDFVKIWETEVISTHGSQNDLSDHRRSDSSSDRSTLKRTAACADTSPEWSDSQDGPSDHRRSATLSTLSDRSNRKRSITSTDVSPGPSNTESDEIMSGPPSSKKPCDYMSEGIDQRIEYCRKGIL